MKEITQVIATATTKKLTDTQKRKQHKKKLATPKHNLFMGTNRRGRRTHERIRCKRKSSGGRNDYLKLLNENRIKINQPKGYNFSVFYD